MNNEQLKTIATALLIANSLEEIVVADDTFRADWLNKLEEAGIEPEVFATTMQAQVDKVDEETWTKVFIECAVDSVVKCKEIFGSEA